MSRIAGAGAIAIAAQFTQSIMMGKCFSPRKVPTRCGSPSLGAAQLAARRHRRPSARARGSPFSESSPEVAHGLRRTFARACVELSTEDAIRRLLPETDVLLNCTYWMPGDPHLVTREMLALMPRGALIVDVAADPHGAIETSEETTHAQPIRVVDGILHYCVQNIPALFPRTAPSLLSGHLALPGAHGPRRRRGGYPRGPDAPPRRLGVAQSWSVRTGRALKRDVSCADDLLAEMDRGGIAARKACARRRGRLAVPANWLLSAPALSRWDSSFGLALPAYT